MVYKWLVPPYVGNMPRGPKGERRPADVVGCAVHVAKIATGEKGESPQTTREAARAAGVADKLQNMEWIVSLIDERAPKRPKTYRRRIPNRDTTAKHGKCLKKIFLYKFF